MTEAPYLEPTTPALAKPVRTPTQPGKFTRFAALYLFVEVLVLAAVFNSKGEPYYRWLDILMFAFLSAQTALLAGWVAWGDRSWLGRCGLLFGATLAAACGYHYVTSFPIDILLALASAQAMFTAVPLLIARCGGWACRLDTGCRTADGRWQFSLAQILIVTTLVAITVRLLLMVPVSISVPILLDTLHISLVTAVIGWFAWAIMLRLPTRTSLPAVLIGSGVISIVGAWYMPYDALARFLPVTQGTLMAISLYFVRSAGYRLSRC